MSIGSSAIGAAAIGGMSLDEDDSSPGVFVVPRVIFNVSPENRTFTVATETRVFTVQKGA
jgi:hypothetical protein